LFLCVGLLILLPSAADVGNINNGWRQSAFGTLATYPALINSTCNGNRFRFHELPFYGWRKGTQGKRYNLLIVVGPLFQY
jgi:hypothetical protein